MSTRRRDRRIYNSCERFGLESLEERLVLARIVTIGDSWASFIANGAPGSIADSGTGNSIQTVLNAFGTGVNVYNGGFYGGTAAQHATSLQQITDILNANPDCDIVYLSSGGNDFLLGQAGGGYVNTVPQEQKNALYESVRTSVQTVVNHILSLRPDVQIAIASYDYINMWEVGTGDAANIMRANLGLGKSGIPLLDLQQNVTFNQGLRDLEQRKVDIANSSSRVAEVYNYGLNATVYGYSGYFGNYAAPTPAPNDLPVRPNLMGNGDPIHLTTTGFNLLALNFYNSFLQYALQSGNMVTSAYELNYGDVRVGQGVGLNETATNAGTYFTKVKNVYFQAATGEFSGGGLSFNPLFRDPTLGSDSATVQYAYNPQNRGNDYQLFSITSDSGNSTVNLIGRGVAPVYSGVSSLNLGTLNVGAGGSLGFAVSNVTPDGDLGSLTDLTLKTAALSGANANLFSLSGFSAGDVVHAGGNRNLSLSFLGAVAPGTYTATLTFQTDQNAALGADGQTFTVDLIVNVADTSITANAGGLYLAQEGHLVVLTGGGTGTISQYEWDLDNDGDFDDATGQVVHYTPTDSGARTIRLRVTGPAGSAVDSAIVNVDNLSPTAQISGPASGVRSQSSQFTLTAGDPSSVDQSAGFTFVIDWDGDGNTDQSFFGASGSTVFHTYSIAGAYTVKATATDKDGGASLVASTSIAIEKGNFGVGGSEIRSNTAAAGSQNSPVVGSDVFGNYVVVWTSSGQDGSSDGIYGQRFSSSGVLVGSEFRVNVVTTSTQSRPAIAMDSDGNFVVAWQSFGQDGSDFGIYARRYNRFGQAQGSEFLVNAFTTGAQVRPSVAMDADGDFVIGWQSNGQDGAGQGVFGRRYDKNGVAQGGEFQINTTTASDQRNVRLASNPVGDFVAVWIDASGHDGAAEGIYGRLYNSAGVAQTSEFKINSYTTGSQLDPTVAIDAVGNFVVAWTSFQDGSGQGVYAQRFNAAGVAQGAEFLVNQTTVDNQGAASASMNADGNFIITWDGNLQDGSGVGVYARRFHASGTALSNEFLVNTTTMGDQKTSSASQTPNGDLVVAWQSANQDGSAEGVYTRRYGYPASNNTPPIANAGGPYVVYEGQSVTLNGSGSSDANGDALWYRWDVNGDGVLGDAVRVSPTLTWADLLAISPSPITDGTAGGVVKNVNVRVGDGTGTTLSATTTITIFNAPPTASITGPSSGFANEALEYTLIATDPSPVDQAAGFSFAIDWDGDGNVDQTVVGVSGTKVYHSFSAAGPNTIRVTATDKDGGVSAETTGAVTLTATAVTSSGSEKRVNTQTADSQNSPTVVMNASGQSVVVWVSANQDGSAEGIFAQRYDSSGAAVGTEFQVNSYTISSQIRPSAAIDSAGNYLITWQSYGQDGNAFGVYARRYNSAGVALGGEFLVSTTTLGSQIRPTVAVNDSGSFVVVWQSFGQDGDGHGLFGQVFDSSGARVGATEFAVNTTITKDQQYAKVAMESAGSFVVVWTSAGGQDGNGDGIFGRRFDSTGAALTAEFQINTTTIGNQFNPTIGMDAGGAFVVAWASSAGQDGNANGVFARRFSSSAVALGGEFQINTYTTGNQQYPTITMEPGGNFVISWESEGQDGSSYAAVARAFDAAGNPISGEFFLNSATAGNQSFAGVAMNAAGQLTTVWQSTGQDGSLEGIYSRRHQLSLPGGDRAAAPDNSSPRRNTGSSGGLTSASIDALFSSDSRIGRLPA